MNTERILVPLSALEHYAYCPRQAGLILLEDGYADDANTVRGTLLHQRVHEPDEETRPGICPNLRRSASVAICNNCTSNVAPALTGGRGSQP